MKTRSSLCLAASLLSLSIGSALAGESNAATGPASQPRTAPKAAPAVDPQALERAKAKFAHALAVVDQFKAAAAAEGITGDNWRFEMLGDLMNGSEADFASVAYARTYADAMSAALQVARGGDASAPGSAISSSAGTAAAVADGLGSATTDLVYVPIAPCRVLDTRVSGAIPASTVRSYFFHASNTGHGACSVTGQIPGTTDAAAFAANVTIDETGLTGFAAGSFLEIYPQGGSTTTSFLNFGPGQIIANAGVISINQTNGQFSVMSNAPTNVIIDTYGVFIAPEPTALECTTPTNTSSFFGVVGASCPAGYTLTGGGCNSTSIHDHTYSSAPSGSSWQCGFWPETSFTIGTTLTAYANCCRVPGR